MENIVLESIKHGHKYRYVDTTLTDTSTHWQVLDTNEKCVGDT